MGLWRVYVYLGGANLPGRLMVLGCLSRVSPATAVGMGLYEWAAVLSRRSRATVPIFRLLWLQIRLG